MIRQPVAAGTDVLTDTINRAHKGQRQFDRVAVATARQNFSHEQVLMKNDKADEKVAAKRLKRLKKCYAERSLGIKNKESVQPKLKRIENAERQLNRAKTTSYQQRWMSYI